MMRLLAVVVMLLLAASLCVAQQGKQLDDAEYEQFLLKLLKQMDEKLPTSRLAGTEVTIQEYKDGEPYGPQGNFVLQAPTKDYPATSPLRVPLPTKPEENDPSYTFRPRPAELTIDGHTVKCLLRGEPELIISPIAYSSQGYISVIKKQWVLAADPKIVLREEKIFVEWDKWFWHTTPSSWWQVTSIGVKKKVGDREILCVELKHDFYFGTDGYNITTDYVSADVPNFTVEYEKVFYRVGKDRSKKTFHFTRTWRLLDFKLPHSPSVLNAEMES